MRKTIIIVVSCCTVLLLLGYTGYRGYQTWKEKHWLGMAKEFAAKSDSRNTVLSLQQVLRFNSKSLEACRMMAGLHEASRSPAALMWRERILELNPDSLDDRLALAKTAMLVGNNAVATNTLAAVGAAGQATADYQNLAGMIALATGEFEVACAHFIEASRLEPWNAVPQVSLAMARLSGTNALDLAEARIALTRVSLNATNANLRCLALRALVNDARRAQQTDSALAFSNQLVAQTNSVFQDRLLRLEVLQETKQTNFRSSLAAFQGEAGADPGRVFLMASWEMSRLGPSVALAWMSGLPLVTQTNQLVAWSMAECRAQLGQWNELQKGLESQNWGEVDFLRHAFLARALREQGLTGAAKAEWVHTVESAGQQKAKLEKLLEFAVAAKWNSEAEELLWKTVNLYPDDKLAVQGLTRVLYGTGRTQLLLNLFTLQSKRKPADLSAKNNLAMTGLLLNVPELKPHDLAKEVYEKAATNAVFASTYAFSLHLQKRDTEALKVLQKLPPKALEDPGIAGYYGLVLSATGNSTKAATYLDWALKGSPLPEEKKLFAQARSAK